MQTVSNYVLIISNHVNRIVNNCNFVQILRNYVEITVINCKYLQILSNYVQILSNCVQITSTHTFVF